jgi:deoxyribonucleoside regulator
MRQRQPTVPILGRPAIDLLTDVATRYYLRDDSQVEIAADLGLDPSTVSRYLKRARDEGIVHVEIRPPRRADVDLGRELSRSYGLSRVVVAPAGEEAANADLALAATAAGFVESLLRNRMRLGISWGRTLAEVVGHLRAGVVADLEIAQLAGGVADPSPGIQGHDLVRKVAELYPVSRVHFLHAPAIVGSAVTGKALLGDPIVQAALAAGRSSDVALVGIGQMDAKSTLVRGGHVSSADWQGLLARHAVGNINTCFFDASGHPLADLAPRTIAVGLEELRSIETVVAVAGGSGKVAAIRGALATGVVDVLVTDEATAEAILTADVPANVGDIPDASRALVDDYRPP